MNTIPYWARKVSTAAFCIGLNIRARVMGSHFCNENGSKDPYSDIEQALLMKDNLGR